MQLSIRWKLSIPFIIIALIVLFVLLPSVRTFVGNRIEAESDARLSNLGNTVAALIEDDEDYVLLSVNFVANLEELNNAGADKDLIGAILLKNKASLELQELNFYAPDYQTGDIPYFYGGPVVTRRLQISQKTEELRDALLREVQTTMAPQSGIVLAPQSSQIIAISPVNGGKNGFVMAVVYLGDDYVTRIGNIIQAGISIVVDNKIVASTIDVQSEFGNFIQSEINILTENVSSDDVSSDHTHAEHIHSEHVQFEDGEYHIVVKPLELNNELQGQIVLAQSDVALEAVIKDLQALLLTFAGFVVLISIVVGVGIALDITRPLDALVEATTKVSSGDINYHVDFSRFWLRDEVFTLSQNFNTMTDQLHDLYSGMEAAVEKRTEELVDALQELEEARDQALEASVAKSNFLANMSHELRTPLNVIIGYGEMLLEDAIDAEDEDSQMRLDRILMSSRHLLSLINDVLDISKIEAGKMNIFIEDFELANLIRDVKEFAAPLMSQNNNKLVAKLPRESGLLIRSDLTKLRQILLNLLSNAAKFTKDGVITLSHEIEISDDECLIFKVKDTGIGMSEEQQANIFEAFQQADSSTTRNYGGTGLGLSIVTHFVEMLGGAISLESEVEVGTTFTLSIPVRLEEKVERVDPEPKLEIGDEERLKILVIDDDPNSLDLLANMIAKKNMFVMTADNAEMAFRLAKEHKPDVITLDIIMPELDGWNILSQLKGDPELSDIPVIIISIVEDKKIGYALGADEYLIKPVSQSALHAVLNRYRCEDKGCKVLLVEDDDPTREMMKSLLMREDWAVIEAVNGRDGLDKLAETASAPDVIILDLMMPEMDGFSFMQDLRKNPDYFKIPVIVVTAKELTAAEQKLLSGWVETIYKKGDYSKKDLVEDIRALIDNHTGKTTRKVIL